MATRATLPLEIRLKIYEILLTEWFDAPGIWMYPAPLKCGECSDLMYDDGTVDNWSDALCKVHMPQVKLPVPAVLQAEPVEIRSHLLKWLARHKGMSTIMYTH